LFFESRVKQRKTSNKMRFMKSLVLALAVFSGAIALPCNHCSQYVADLKTAHESQNYTKTGDFSNLIVDGYQPHNDPHETHKHPFIRRDSREASIHTDEWRNRLWPEKERRRWNSMVLFDFEKVVRAHLPDGIVLPELLLPTTDRTLLEIYKKSATELALQDMKSMELKRSDLAQLKRLAKNFLLASKCQWSWACSTYYDWRYPFWAVGPRSGWKEAVYDPLRGELDRKTTLEGLVNLGRRLKAETNFKIPQHEESR
jgi:hypothetical protein